MKSRLYQAAMLPIIINTLAGCAFTYEGPKTKLIENKQSINASKSEILTAARQVLVSEGYQITSSDESSGTISTAMKNLRLSPDHADCGLTMGLDYLKDNRTSTKVGIGIIAIDGMVTIKANVEGEYKPGAIDQDITLTCVSKGLLEQSLYEKIKIATQR
jgi:hypothetical protein